MWKIRKPHSQPDKDTSTVTPSPGIASAKPVAVVWNANAVECLSNREAGSLDCHFQAELKLGWINLFPIISRDPKTMLG